MLPIGEFDGYWLDLTWRWGDPRILEGRYHSNHANVSSAQNKLAAALRIIAKIPAIPADIKWKAHKDGMVTAEFEAGDHDWSYKLTPRSYPVGKGDDHSLRRMR